MKSKPRGKAIIINIEKYDIAAKNREGSHTDLVNLTLLLRSLDFHVDPWTNFDSQVRKSTIRSRFAKMWSLLYLTMNPTEYFVNINHHSCNNLFINHYHVSIY